MPMRVKQRGLVSIHCKVSFATQQPHHYPFVVSDD